MKPVVSRSMVVAVALAVIGSAVTIQRAWAQAGVPAGNQQPAGGPAIHPAGSSDAREFINQMAVAGMAEVELGKMATEKAANADVKAFGQMMVTDHTKAGKELERVAAQLNVQPPAQLDQKHRELADRLSKLQGSAFDREYIAAMVQGHQEVAASLQSRAGAAGGSGTRSTSGSAATQSTGRADSEARVSGASTAPVAGTASTNASGGAAATAGSAGEQALSEWATKTLPTVQQHLERARTIQQQVK